MKTVVVVTAEFSSAHFYRQAAWSAERNLAEFGKCFTEYGHGHNYRVEVGFVGAAGSAAAELRRVVRSVVDVLDHQHLNFVVPEFRDVVPTTENIALYLMERLRAALLTAGTNLTAGAVIASLKLFEMDDLWVELRA